MEWLKKIDGNVEQHVLQNRKATEDADRDIEPAPRTEDIIIEFE